MISPVKRSVCSTALKVSDFIHSYRVMYVSFSDSVRDRPKLRDFHLFIAADLAANIASKIKDAIHFDEIVDRFRERHAGA